MPDDIIHTFVAVGPLPENPNYQVSTRRRPYIFGSLNFASGRFEFSAKSHLVPGRSGVCYREDARPSHWIRLFLASLIENLVRTLNVSLRLSLAIWLLKTQFKITFVKLWDPS